MGNEPFPKCRHHVGDTDGSSYTEQRRHAVFIKSIHQTYLIKTRLVDICSFVFLSTSILVHKCLHWTLDSGQGQRMVAPLTLRVLKAHESAASCLDIVASCSICTNKCLERTLIAPDQLTSARNTLILNLIESRFR